MASLDNHNQLGPALVDFSNNISSLNEATPDSPVNETTLIDTLSALTLAKAETENEIRSLSKDIAEEVDDWITHMKAVQGDIDTSLRLFNNIIRHAEFDEQLVEEINNDKNHLSTLKNEYSFNQGLSIVLRDIREVHIQIFKIEKLIEEKSPLDALMKLEDTCESFQKIFHGRSIRILQNFELKFSDLRKTIHEDLLKLWEKLVSIDKAHNSITIHKSLSNQKIGLIDVVTGLDYFEECPKVAKKLSRDLNNLILKPRIMFKEEILPSIKIKDYSISRGPPVHNSVKALLSELKALIFFLDRVFPVTVLKPLSEAIILDVSNRVLQGWLNQTVPSTVDEVVNYQKTLDEVTEFIAAIESIGWPGSDSFRDWVENFSTIWLNKRKEITLEWTRNQILNKVNNPLIKERVGIQSEKEDQSGIFKPTGTTENQDCDVAWGFEEDLTIEKTDPKIEDCNTVKKAKDTYNVSNTEKMPDVDESLEDDVVDAWGWGDEDIEEAMFDKEYVQKTITEPDKLEKNAPINSSYQNYDSDLGKLPLSEEYFITELPRFMRAAVINAHEDCLVLSRDPHHPVYSVASKLLNLPSQILAMYRAISPAYYANQTCGNFYRNNDSIWLAEEIKEYLTKWNQRPDIPPHYQIVNKIDRDVLVLESFAKRALITELNNHKDTITSMLGGTHNIFQKENLAKINTENSISAVISHIQNQTALWRNILRYSTWSYAAGILVNTVATRIVKDAIDLPDISVDDTRRIAAIISRVETLDNLFLRSFNSSNGQWVSDEETMAVPLTTQFADKWMKMKFLSEVLQSNLKDIRYLWFESELSLFFTVEEVVGLIRSSFEMNSSVRLAIKEIRDNPRPKDEVDMS